MVTVPTRAPSRRHLLRGLASWAGAATLPAAWGQRAVHGVLGFVPAAGSPDPARSHFEAQHHLEIGVPGKTSAADGWMNTLAQVRSARTASDGAIALGVGEANPRILVGSASVQRVPRGQAATRPGALGDARTKQAILKLYAGQDVLSKALRDGADSRLHTSQTLGSGMADPETMEADNGARSASGLLLDARHLGVLMRKDARLALGFLSAGGWDTHANQGSADGALARSLTGLAGALVQLRRDFCGPRDVIAVMSEFGRTCAENGTRGTDHGHGNAMWLIGNPVQGGRWHGRSSS